MSSGLSEERAFLWDDNIPSIPTIPILSSPTTPGDEDTHKRRNRLLRMISDPKCYNTREQLVQARRHQSVAEVSLKTLLGYKLICTNVLMQDMVGQEVVITASRGCRARKLPVNRGATFIQTNQQLNSETSSLNMVSSL